MNQSGAFDINSGWDLLAFLKRLLVSDFMPHGHCYFWRPEILWTSVFSDAAIVLAYYSMPLALLYLIHKRKDLVFDWMFAMFGIFIFACGTTHLMGVWTVWHGTYRLDVAVKFLTALVSLLTPVLLWPLIPKALAIPSPTQLRKANEALQAANEKIIEHEKIKSDFFSNISHELRTPLTLILSPLEALIGGEFGSLADAQKKITHTMHNNTVRLLQMVQGLLDFQKLEAKKVEVKREPTDIVSLTRSILEDFQPMTKQRGLNLRFEPAQGEGGACS